MGRPRAATAHQSRVEARRSAPAPARGRAQQRKLGATIRAGAVQARNTNAVTASKQELAMDAELNPKELLDRILELKEHL